MTVEGPKMRRVQTKNEIKLSKTMSLIFVVAVVVDVFGVKLERNYLKLGLAKWWL